MYVWSFIYLDTFWSIMIPRGPPRYCSNVVFFIMENSEARGDKALSIRGRKDVWDQVLMVKYPKMHSDKSQEWDLLW